MIASSSLSLVRTDAMLCQEYIHAAEEPHHVRYVLWAFADCMVCDWGF